MKPIINFKALYLLLLILAAYGIMALIRSGKDSKAAVPDNWYRSPSPVWSERSICQVGCLGISDSNLALIFRHGQLVSPAGSNAILEGRTFKNEILRLYLTQNPGGNLVDSLLIEGQESKCDCD